MNLLLGIPILTHGLDGLQTKTSNRFKNTPDLTNLLKWFQLMSVLIGCDVSIFEQMTAHWHQTSKHD